MYSSAYASNTPPAWLTATSRIAVNGKLVPTLLHISDLHRTSQPRLNNDELLAAIVSDATRWSSEGIPRPEIIVVSGDLIQGAKLGAPDSDNEIENQYREAGNFLRRLGEEFVDSDQSRIIVVPGNHDVHWNRSQKGMKPIETCPEGIATKAFEAASSLRWNWRDLQAYEISDQHLYESRLQHFRKFQAEFYAGIKPNPLSHGCDDLFFVEYPDLGLVVVGFPSWHGNDYLCHVGEIDPALLAFSQTLVAKSKIPIAIAVWHHCITGGPRTHDYMDQRIVQRLIDFGFNVGLHGHQHYPGAAPYELCMPNLTSMVVIGAGSLAVGNKELPMGERRQFNVVVIDPESDTITVHVRGMSPAGVFTGSHRDDFGGNTFIKLKLPAMKTLPKSPTTIQRLDEAMTAVAVKRYEEALVLIADIPACRAKERRQIEIEALKGLDRKEQLIDLLDLPRSVDEVCLVVSLLIDSSRFDEAMVRLTASKSLIAPIIFADLRAAIDARRITP